ncbi:MAG TPA: phosphoribosylformylglycinamidine synthase subunit PurL [Thermoanaerobaculia bacterium]|nr:phosphoribosylformylglycinamidine synthase subunit PurL [Thermoanaerobaculia bacterium]
MHEPAINSETIAAHGLTNAEYTSILQILGRAPNYTELGIFSVMWSEHCSYKSSRVHLRKFPTSGPRVIQGPGENAGVIDIGDGWVAAFKMESHNHPSFIEPYQGAATGVGGILRDIFTMGARPIACLDSLRFGDLDAPRMRYLVDGVVRGIGGYGNCIGIPTVGGETSFHSCYNGNILVNAFALGVTTRDKIFKGTASGVGNPVIYVGSKTGRDGIHGATMASAEFDQASEEKRPTVQVGDPFTEKLLLEACLEVMESDAIVGIQDMGAAGLTSSSFEMAGRAGTGVRLVLDDVPVRESGMTPYEIMLSESQERMLIVAKRGREADVVRIFEKWDLNASVIGEVTDDGFVRIFWRGDEVAAIPVDPISTEAPVYERPMRRPAGAAVSEAADDRLRARRTTGDQTDTLFRLLASPNLCSKHWIFEQYDTTVRTNTIAGPERRDAAIVRVKGSGRALAITSDVNPVYCHLDPYEGGKQAVAEAARNVAVSGGRPVAITDCLNFGSPERPEIMWQFSECIRGISDACNALGTPVVSGNVSFYNETEGRAIYPTPTVGMVGILDREDIGCGLSFPDASLDIVLLGTTSDELGGSEWQQMFAPGAIVPPPRVDLDREKALVDCFLAAHERRLLRSAHDLSNGGLAVALAESSMEGIGCHVDLAGHADDLDAIALLFGESQARAIVSTRHLDEVLTLAKTHGVTAMRIGRTEPAVFLIERNGTPLVRTTTPELARIWRSAFGLLLGGDSIDDVIRGVGEDVPEVLAH